jgi:predicted ArsR family transcriptional regulator
MNLKKFEDQVSGVAALDNVISRRAYRLVIDQGWVGRDQAAEALHLARSVAAFHLEKLVDAGLVKVRFERLSGRTGPGAGRPTKLYGRSTREFDISLPPRRYDLAGSLLAHAVWTSESEGTPIAEALADTARTAGEAVGAATSKGIPLVEVLAQHGYEPKEQEHEIKLLNCPFDILAEQHRELVCGMNLDFLKGVIAGMNEAESFTPRLSPEPGYCCVRFVAV